ncbi:MAG TPA: GyrI-like domain-containing protein [Acidimicrobiia bacterium]|nr:GyrI-like domain-containing protein [Acidimicrobiia bacterium]
METRIIDTRSIGSRKTAVRIAELDVDVLGEWLPETFGSVALYLDKTTNPPIGPPFARYRRLGARRFRVEAGFPVERRIYGSDEIVGSSLPGGTVAITTHTGPYDGMEATYEALASWLYSRDAIPVGDPWEIYFSEPTDPPGTWRTDIVQPYVRR